MVRSGAVLPPETKPKRSRARADSNQFEPGATAGRVPPEADLTWMLHRAAQRMRVVMQEQAEQHGLQLRDYLVLSALRSLKGPTQLTIGHVLGLDKTTLTSLLDRLERAGLATRRVDPRDRRAHVLEATEAGLVLQAEVAAAVARVEADMLGGIKPADQYALRSMLSEIINAGQDGDLHIAGSCI